MSYYPAEHFANDGIVDAAVVAVVAVVAPAADDGDAYCVKNYVAVERQHCYDEDEVDGNWLKEFAELL